MAYVNGFWVPDGVYPEAPGAGTLTTASPTPVEPVPVQPTPPPPPTSTNGTPPTTSSPPPTATPPSENPPAGQGTDSNGSLPGGYSQPTTETVTNTGNPATTNSPVTTGYTPSPEGVAVVPVPQTPGGIVLTDGNGVALPGQTPTAATPPTVIYTGEEPTSTPTSPPSDTPPAGAPPPAPAAGDPNDFTRDWTNIVNTEDYAALDLTNTQAFAAAQNLYNSTIAQAMAANANALAAYTGNAMQAAAQQGMENVYGTENTYGAQGAGMSGAAQAAAARGMAAPIAQANQAIAGMSAEQASQLNAQRFGVAQDLASTYTGVVAPQYTSSMSPGEVALMKELSKSSL